MNIIIIENEGIIALEMSSIIQQLRPDYRILKVLSSVNSAIEFLKRNRTNIDLIFSDIRLGDGMCFEVFNEVKTSIPIIFCTAFGEYAFQAINANGIAFLLKPWTIESIQIAIEKFEVFTKVNRKL